MFQIGLHRMAFKHLNRSVLSCGFFLALSFLHQSLLLAAAPTEQKQADLRPLGGAGILTSPPLQDRFNEHPWSLSLGLGAPEIWSAGVLYRPSPWGGFWAHYALVTPFRVNVEMESKTLLKREDFIIKSPQFTIPVDLNFGPHEALGGIIFPFSGTFFLSAGIEHRIVTVKSKIESQLIFVDAEGEALSHTAIGVGVQSRTEQVLLRGTMGQQFTAFEDRLLIAWFLGATVPLKAHSRTKTTIVVKNPSASDPGRVDAVNLSEAEQEQERILRDKASTSLKSFESMVLPLLGLAISWPIN